MTTPTTTAKNNYGFGKRTLTVMQITETKDKSGFICKLQHKESKEAITPFGKKVQNIQQTFYMKLAEKPALGFSAEINLDEYTITERPFEIDADETTQTAATTVLLKWLHL